MDFFLRRVGNRSALAGAMGILSVMPIRHSTDDSRVLALSLSLAPSVAAVEYGVEVTTSSDDGDGVRTFISVSNIVGREG